MKRLALALAASLAIACGSSPVPHVAERPPVNSAASNERPSPDSPTGATPTADTREARLIAHALRRVERARGFASARPVPGVLLDRADLIARVKSHVARELPPEAIRNEGLVLELLGFVPTDFDYERAEYALLEDQLAGYYEPADQTMYMASDLGDDEAAATLAHELVHALQDQRWNLEQRSRYRPGDGDRSEAVSALAEGDATSAMFDVILGRSSGGNDRTALDLPDDVFSEQIRQSMNLGAAAEAPRIMRSSLAAPYIYGTLFVHALRRRGGWDAVNRAWDDPPTTSEQVMHPDKWLAHEPPVAIEAPSFGALGAGWKTADEDSEGELGTRVAFEEWLDTSAAADASAGWGGDRGVLLTNGERSAFAWRLRYDPGSNKKDRVAEVFPALVGGLDKTLGPASVRDANFDCHERADRGPLAVARAGSDLLLVAGPARVRAHGGWTAGGTCALARKWIREIAAKP